MKVMEGKENKDSKTSNNGKKAPVTIQITEGK